MINCTELKYLVSQGYITYTTWFLEFAPLRIKEQTYHPDLDLHNTLFFCEDLERKIQTKYYASKKDGRVKLPDPLLFRLYYSAVELLKNQGNIQEALMKEMNTIKISGADDDTDGKPTWGWGNYTP